MPKTTKTAGGSGSVPQAEAATVQRVAPAITINRQRIPKTIDFLGAQGPVVNELEPFRIDAATKVYLGLQQVQTSLQAITTALNGPALPMQLICILHNPDGTAASTVQVTLDPVPLGGKPPAVTVLTNDAGGFTLSMPAGVLMPSGGITLQVHGANGNASVTILSDRIAANGLVGVVVLPSSLTPLPVSILAALQALMPTTLPDPGGPQPPTAPQLPVVKLGETGPCSQEFNAQPTIDSFPFGVFLRLVEPRLSIVNQVQRLPLREGVNEFIPLPVYLTGADTLPENQISYADRIPVEQPISVDGFRDQIMGLDPFGIFVADETVPMAASLGLGYVLEMQQQWTFAGVGLGDLVYSLPLAPGEQQQVAVFERLDTSYVTESEFFSESQTAQQSALADTSTAATFNSAFNEVINSGSSFQTSSVSGGGGFNLLVVSGGAGGSSSSGNSQQWLSGQRDIAQNAAEQTHSAAFSQASARRNAARTGMRMASASESESVTTKTVSNHNHTHAMTVQYWEVLRNYNVTTVVDGLTIACLVPMQIIRFMPPGQTLTIADPGLQFPKGRPDVLTRYSAIIKHLDVLRQAVPQEYQNGLTLLAQFAADPTAQFEQASGVAEDVIAFTLTGSFVPCETISIRAVTRRNTRVGPVVLSNTAASIPDGEFTSKDALLSFLLKQRQNSFVAISGNLALPPSLNRADIVGFEIIRNFKPLSYTLISQAQAAANNISQLFAGLFGGGGGNSPTSPLDSIYAAEAVSVPTTVTLSSGDLESALNGPLLISFTAAIVEYSGAGTAQNPSVPLPPNETYANETLGFVELPPQAYPVPALQIAPVLRYSELLEIERAVHHVVRNTTQYSKAVWSSLTPDERAILLDAYTIGVPVGGVLDPSQMVPLLNCVENRLLGFFGNSMVLPFIIPQDVAQSMGIDPSEIQRGLLAYQQANFQPPVSTFSLPTRGVLAEAVLGHCPSAEKIDLTRFWNWQDSPSDTAPSIAPVTLPTSSPSIAAGLSAPNTLGNLPNLINNVMTAPSPGNGLLSKLASGAISQKDFDTALTGAQQLVTLMQNSQNSASQARSDAIKASTQLQSQLISTIGSIVGGKGSQSGSGTDSSAGGSSGTGGSSGGGGSSAASDVASALIPIIVAALL
ncbi:hypothetical protein LptCag_0032 [Leptospirillum ferriphilum]|uniref:Uncharacterized protein n=1 Tax=Leptospirillum ferriphilum TaxID=178606 RepID=A0A094X4B6_9BACT|nr:hypothetical protein [Leptospirillum ferriphilum]KGA93419.1 hypothetical protein LptCag_0032 [Leptospirillum ferriphilum]